MAKLIKTPVDFRPPIRSTWKDPIGTPLTDRRITTRIREGWYGEIPKLRLAARSADKAKRKHAKELLKRFEGVSPKAARAKRTIPLVDIAEFV